MAKYSIGIDYGTLSARALLLNIQTGEEVCVSEMAYPHGVMDECLPSADGTPLCKAEGFEDTPHAYVKLWKHHAAQYCADELNAKAEAMGEKWLPLYGGKISSEWMIPKIMQILKEEPRVYDACDQILEAGDWVVWQLVGHQARSACNAGFKGIPRRFSGRWIRGWKMWWKTSSPRISGPSVPARDI